MKNALSFDIEEYFHAEALRGAITRDEWPGLASRVEGVTRRLLDLLEETGARATFFVLGWVAERHPALVRDIDARGHEVACHSFGHRMIHQLTRREFGEDTARAKAVIEDATGRPVYGYRAPTFSVMRGTLWSLDVLCEAGFRYDSSIFPIVHDRYGIADAPRFPHRLRTPAGGEIAEFPLSTLACLGCRVPLAGGGYFRLAPYGLTRWGMQWLNARERQPAIVYLHPWELDPAHPGRPAGAVARLRHTVSIGQTEDKLRRLLADFAFGPVGEVLAETGVLCGGGKR